MLKGKPGRKIASSDHEQQFLKSQA